MTSAAIDTQMASGPTAGSARCIHELVAEQAARTPDRVAVSHGDRRLTYRQLDTEADALAARLIAAGVCGT
jgi:non-ribosomal peptide synthetase component F